MEGIELLLRGGRRCASSIWSTFSTQTSPEARIAEGRFREDLFYRLAVVTISLPSLSDRDADVHDLVHAFASTLSRKLTFSDAAIAWLRQRRWSGNVRELRNVVERLALLADADAIDVASLEELARESGLNDPHAEIDRLARELLALPDRLGSKLRAIERAVLHHAVEACNGNKSAAARLIGVHRKALERKWERMSGEEKDEEESE